MARDQWHHWMQQGNIAWQQGQWQQAQHAFNNALHDIWPVWVHSSLLPTQWASDDDTLCLPTCCLTVCVRNLACCMQAQGRLQAARALLRQLQQWFHTALQQPDTPCALAAILLMQQADLAYQLQEYAEAAGPELVTIRHEHNTVWLTTPTQLQ